MEALKLSAREYEREAWAELLNRPRSIDWKLSKVDRKNIIAFIEDDTIGYEWKDFDLIYEGDNYNLQLCGRILRSWHCSGDGFTTPREVWLETDEIRIEFYEATDMDGDIIRTNIGKWLTPVPGKNYSILG